ncbi:MAG: DivIVA domain-containing protein [Firmicutes bacterium]|nr:DivIVA domain-containing protein [Bacillota bacterium]
MTPDAELGRELFGYRKDDVDRLLAELHRNLRQANENNESLTAELTAAKEEMANISEASNKIVTKAERTAADLIEHARKEADFIINNAKREAEAIIDSAERHKKALEEKCEVLENVEDELKLKLKSVLEDYMALVEDPTNEEYRVSGKINDFQEIANERLQSPPVVTELGDSSASDALLREFFPHITETDGISMVWLFDDRGNVLSVFGRPEVSLIDLTSAAIHLDACINHLKNNLGCEQTRFIFIELNDVILILNPITNGIVLGIVASNYSAVGEILKVVNDNISGLREALNQT